MGKENPNPTEGEKPKTILELIEDKGVEGLSPEELDSCIRGACKPQGSRIGSNEHQVVVGVCLAMERQGRLIKELEKRNKKTQFWFAVLAIGSLIIGALSLLWQAGLDTHKLCRFVLPEYMTSKCGAPLETQGIPIKPQPAQPSKGTNP